MGEEREPQWGLPSLDPSPKWSRPRCGAPGTDSIDLYQSHRPNPATNVEETLSPLSDLVHQGKVLTIGQLDVPLTRPARSSSPVGRRADAWRERFRCADNPYACWSARPRIERTAGRRALPHKRDLWIRR